LQISVSLVPLSCLQVKLQLCQSNPQIMLANLHIQYSYFLNIHREFQETLCFTHWQKISFVLKINISTVFQQIKTKGKNLKIRLKLQWKYWVNWILCTNVYICIDVGDPIIRGRIGNLLFRLTSPHFCSCIKPQSGFPTPAIVNVVQRIKWGGE
jgi:hypothetical protein